MIRAGTVGLTSTSVSDGNNVQWNRFRTAVAAAKAAIRQAALAYAEQRRRGTANAAQNRQAET